MRILSLMNKNNSFITNKSLIVCINYVLLLGFYLCHFEKHEFVNNDLIVYG